MRSFNLDEISHFSPKVTWAAGVSDLKLEPKPEVKVPEPAKADALTAALYAFPGQLAAAMASMPAPVMAPRPEGSWIIEVSRDSSGQMTQLKGKFHETK